ncbi:MAG TPA: ABC transporter permease, partial [Puia sp.]|nr:ABC transporter permease [Puia sp.]
MLKNYFRTAWRNIKGGRGYSVLNILGLAAGMAVALLIGLWVFNEYSYNRWLPNYRHVYQVRLNFVSEGKMNTQEPVSLPLAAALKKNIPGIQYVAESDWMGSHGLVV